MPDILLMLLKGVYPGLFHSFQVKANSHEQIAHFNEQIGAFTKSRTLFLSLKGRQHPSPGQRLGEIYKKF